MYHRDCLYLCSFYGLQFMRNLGHKIPFLFLHTKFLRLKFLGRNFLDGCLGVLTCPSSYARLLPCFQPFGDVSTRCLEYSYVWRLVSFQLSFQLAHNPYALAQGLSLFGRSRRRVGRVIFHLLVFLHRPTFLHLQTARNDNSSLSK